MEQIKKNAPWLIAALVFALGGFFTGKKFYYSRGFNAGAVFADTSGYKQGYRIGFELGYELRDSIAKTEKSDEGDKLNLHIIYEELGNPDYYIHLSAEMGERKTSGMSSAVTKFVKAKISSSASYARYKEIAVTAKFLDRRNARLAEKTIEIPEILYPGRTILFQISDKEIPDFTEKVELELEKAQGVD